MTNQRFLELAPKIDNRYLSLTGKIYELSHKRGKVAGSEVKKDIYTKIAKEFGVGEDTVRSYLRVYHLPADCLRDMESGRPWIYYGKALGAPEGTRQFVYQKIKNNDFSSKDEVEAWIRQYKNVQPKEEEQSMKTNLPEQTTSTQGQPSESFAEQVRKLFRTQKYVNVEDVALERTGKTPSDEDKRAVISTIYNIRRSIEKELGKRILREGYVFRVVPVVDQQSASPAIASPKTKTAVLVIREVRDDEGVRYELDIVGECNRGMMKEALKQLMEVFI